MDPHFWKIILFKEFPVRPFPINYKQQFITNSFEPYQNNGGTIISISLEDFSIIASDTRIISGFSIPVRNAIRIVKISENILLSTSGMQVDMLILQEELKKSVSLWESENKKNISVSGGAYFLSSILYSRRFFPYYTFNILSGKELDGRIKSFSFDAVGSFEFCSGASSGSGQLFIQPILDSNINWYSLKPESKKQKILKKLIMIKHLFLKISKRNIEIGDGVQIFLFTRKGILVENNVLKCD